MKTLFMMGLVLFFAALWANASDLDKEVNAFQVELVSEKAYLAKMKKNSKKAKKEVKAKTTKKTSSKLAVKNKNTPTKQIKAPEVKNVTYYDDSKIEMNEAPAPTMTYTARPEVVSTSRGFFLRVTATPQFMMSGFDGSDDSKVSPRGLGDSMKSGFAGNVTMDLNLFRDTDFVVETGVSYMTLGAKTGIKQDPALLNSSAGFGGFGMQPYSFNQNQITYEDDLKSQYLGIILAIKWLPSGLDSSGFFVRAGALPMFLMDKQTSQGFGYYPYTPFYGNGFVQNNDSRFGGINSFDIAAQLGLGYSFNVISDLNVLADVTATQGFLPVMGNYNVYNASLAAGIGLSYKL